MATVQPSVRTVHVGFTGSRVGCTLEQRTALERALSQHRTATLHHGDCVGADVEAHAIAKRLGLRVVLHPPISDEWRAFCDDADETLDPLPYLSRNHAIVDSADLLIACPRTLQEIVRSGTWATVRYARLWARKPCVVILPDGTVTP